MASMKTESISMTPDEWARVHKKLTAGPDAWPTDGPITSTIYHAATGEIPICTQCRSPLWEADDDQTETD